MTAAPMNQMVGPRGYGATQRTRTLREQEADVFRRINYGLKAALNADCDGQAGLQELAGNATLLYYMTEEGQEGRNAFVEKRKPDFGKFPKRP